MPVYEFRNKDTQEVFEKVMSIKDKEIYLENNSNIETYFSTPNALGDAVRLGLKRPDDGFKEVLAKIQERTPGAQLNDRMSRSYQRKYNFS